MALNWEAMLAYMHAGPAPCTKPGGKGDDYDAQCFLCGHYGMRGEHCPFANVARSWCEQYLRAREGQ